DAPSRETPSVYDAVTAGCHRGAPIRDRVARPRLGETAQPQPAGLADAAGVVLRLVAGPGLLERRAPFEAGAHDPGLGEADDRRHDLDACLGPRAQADGLLVGPIELRPAVGVARRVLPHSTHEQ